MIEGTTINGSLHWLLSDFWALSIRTLTVSCKIDPQSADVCSRPLNPKFGREALAY